MNEIDDENTIEKFVNDEKLDKEKFYNRLLDYDIDLITIDKEQNYMPSDLLQIINSNKNGNTKFHEFNTRLKQMVRNETITFLEVLNFLNDDFLEFNEVMKCFDDESQFLMKRELSKKYKLERPKTSLGLFFN